MPAARALDGMEVFLAVADANGFRAAAARLGITGSAVSQALRRLEDRIGVPLVVRTTRSVRLTDAGQRLYEAVRPALDQVAAAVETLGTLGETPRGALRIHTSVVAETLVGERLLAGFLTSHPHVTLDIVVSDAPVDIVRENYDAGIQLGEVIDRDMIAVPLTDDLRLAVVGAPSYFAEHGVPRHPRELTKHVCLNWHPTPEAPPYRWEFTDKGRDFSVAVPARVLSTDAALNRRLARAGVGLTLAFEGHVRESLERGDLVAVLGEFCAPFPGYYLYYPERRQSSTALRALVDHLRRQRERQRSRRGRKGPRKSR